MSSASDACNSNSSRGINIMDLSNLKLYGRSEETSTLFDAYRRVSDPPSRPRPNSPLQPGSELVVVSGYSGTGKSALVWQLRDRLGNVDGGSSSTHIMSLGGSDRGCGRFVSGKFDDLRRSEPYSAIIMALGEVCDLILDDPDVGALRRTSEAITDAVSPEGRRVLTTVIPRLRDIIGDGDRASSSDNASTEMMRNQFTFAFRSLLRAICSPTHALVLFLDDLQWADVASLDLIKALLTDTESAHVLFVLSFRENEVEANHPFMVRLRDLEKQPDTIAVTRIHLGNLGIEIINDIVSDVLRLEACETRSLSDLVCRKTNGNIFFVTRFLESLRDESLLVYSFPSLMWTWDVDLIESSTMISDNVVDLILGKLRRLPSTVQAVLKIASCFGNYFVLNVLEKTLACGSDRDNWHKTAGDSPPTNGGGVVDRLDIALKEGLVEKYQRTTYKFVHDRIQQASYSLITDGQEREFLHLQIGELMWKSDALTEERNDWMLFVTVDQLNLGSARIEDQGKRIDLARLNQRAGKKASLSSAFVPAANYFQKGIALLDAKSTWEDQYELTLGLHSALAKMDYICGNTQRSKDNAKLVIMNATSFMDKTEAYFTLFKLTVHAEGDAQGGIDVGREFFAELGESFNSRPSWLYAKADLRRTRWMLRGRSDSDLIMMPAIKNERKQIAIKFAMLMTPCAFMLLRQELFATITFRVMQSSLKHGVCGVSATGYGMYGMILCKKGDLREGHRFGRLALALQENLDDGAWQSTINYAVFTFVNHWRDPLYKSLDPLVHAYEDSMLRGDVMLAFSCAQSYCSNYLHSGLPLAPLETDLRAYCRQMRDYHQKSALACTLPLWQFVLNMMGRSKDPLQLTGEAMNQEEMLNAASKEHNTASLAVTCSMRLELAYLFGDFGLAGGLLITSRGYAKGKYPSFNICRFAFLEGLISLALAKRTKQRRWMVRARGVIKKMQSWAKSAVLNILHMLMILKAEFASIRGDQKEETKTAYDAAISAAGRNGFVQDKALANERAGMFFLEAGDNDWASYYLSAAHEVYCEWGAHAKAEHLRHQNGSLLKITEERKTVLGPRSRSRFVDTSNSHKKLDCAPASENVISDQARMENKGKEMGKEI